MFGAPDWRKVCHALELFSIPHVNPVNNNVRRNIYSENPWYGGLGHPIPQSINTSNEICFVHRYLPPTVGRLAIYCLWLVVPFVDHLAAVTGQTLLELRGQHTDLPSFMEYGMMNLRDGSLFRQPLTTHNYRA